LDAEYGYCVLEFAAVAVATVVSDAVRVMDKEIILRERRTGAASSGD